MIANKLREGEGVKKMMELTQGIQEAIDKIENSYGGIPYTSLSTPDCREGMRQLEAAGFVRNWSDHGEQRCIFTVKGQEYRDSLKPFD